MHYLCQKMWALFFLYKELISNVFHKMIQDTHSVFP